jgi:hypothetical protein
MEKIDRLGWAAGISFVSHGARIGVRVNDPDALDWLRPYLPPGWRPARSPVVDYLYSLRIGGQTRPGLRHFHLLYSGVSQLARTHDFDELSSELESALHFNVAVAATKKLFVHAGVVGWHDRAIVMPGRSLSGKTSLVAALVAAGATYYSDEYAVFDARGRVHPYPKALSIRENGGRPRRCSAEQLGGRVGSKPLPCAMVVVTDYRSAARWRPKPLSAGQALLALLDNTPLARTHPELSLSVLKAAATGAVSLRSPRGEAGDVAPLLLDRLVSTSV